MAELNEYLQAVGNAIKEKKGSTDVINAKDFPKEILALKGYSGITANEYNLNKYLEDIANAIRQVYNINDKINAQDFATMILAIEMGGGDYIVYSPGQTEITDSQYANKLDTETIIPSTIESIGNTAFLNCENLINAVVPVSVNSIGNGIFQGCNALEELTLPYLGTGQTGTNKTLAYTFGGTDNAIAVPSSLKKVKITGGNNVNDITGFFGCSNLEELDVFVLDGFGSVPDYWFQNNGLENLKKLHLPAIHSFGSWCENFLAYLQYSTKWTNLTQAQIQKLGCMYFPAVEELSFDEIYYDFGRRVEISASAFAYCNAKKINIPIASDIWVSLGCSYDAMGWDDVYEPNSAPVFKSCEATEEITIGGVIDVIPNYCFDYCRKIKKITFTGEMINYIGKYAFGGGIANTNVPVGFLNYKALGERTIIYFKGIKNLIAFEDETPLLELFEEWEITEENLVFIWDDDAEDWGFEIYDSTYEGDLCIDDYCWLKSDYEEEFGVSLDLD